MTTVVAQYKGFTILAFARLVGRGGPTVPAHQRRYLPTALLTVQGENVDAWPALRLAPRSEQALLANPYLAMTIALQHAKLVIDGDATAMLVGDTLMSIDDVAIVAGYTKTISRRQT